MQSTPHAPQTSLDNLIPTAGLSNNPLASSHVTDMGHDTVQHTGSGPVIGIIIIVFMLALGGLYFWGAELNRTQSTPLLPSASAAQ